MKKVEKITFLNTQSLILISESMAGIVDFFKTKTGMIVLAIIIILVVVLGLYFYKPELFPF